MLTVSLLAFNDGTTANIKVTLANDSDDNLGSIDVRSPVPSGMTFIDSTPVCTFYPSQLGWIHRDLAPGKSVTFRYRLDTHGLVSEARATATLASQTYTSALFPVGTVASPPKILPIPNLAPVP